MVVLQPAPRGTQPKELVRSMAPWAALGLAIWGALSYVLGMVLPYYANDLDRFAQEDVPWGHDRSESWPFDTAFSLPSELAGIYAMVCAPFVAGGVAVWAGYRLWVDRRCMTRQSRAIILLAAAVCMATWGWLLTPLSSTLLIWWLD